MEVVLHNPRGTKALWLPYLPIHLLYCQELVHLDGLILQRVSTRLTTRIGHRSLFYS